MFGRQPASKIMKSQTDLIFDPQLIRKFDINGPRYTSYPTADRFVEAFNAEALRAWLAKRAVGGVSKPLSLYFHIPFCNTICYYCACNKIITKDHGRSAKYLKYLAKEIEMQAACLEGSRQVTQLHLGGGTPTFLSHDEMRELMAAVREHFTLVPNGEYSIEVDPRKVDFDTVKLLAELGFNRMSVGVQDFAEDVQQAVNRIQSFDETKLVIDAARANGLAATQYQAAAEIIPDVVSGVNVYSVTYNTEFKGAPVVASGLICTPTAPGTYPILSFQNGTNTLHSAAPTADPQNLGYQMIEYIASAGYVVILPDYLGFGASSSLVHPYLHKESTVQSVLDMLRAVAEFDEDVAKDISVTTNCYLLGYSQGGWATMALLRALDEDYSSEFTVKAASCGAGPYDLRYFNTAVTGLTEYPMPVFLGCIANAYTTYDLYPNELTDMFNSQYASAIPGLYDGKHSSELINSQLTTSISGLFTAEYLSGAESDQKYLGVRNALSDNSIYGWDCDVPLLLMHGTADSYVMPAISQSQYDMMIGSGTSPLTCFYVTLNGLDHSQASVPALLAGYEFFKTYR